MRVQGINTCKSQEECLALRKCSVNVSCYFILQKNINIYNSINNTNFVQCMPNCLGKKSRGAVLLLGKYNLGTVSLLGKYNFPQQTD